jgi:hypothetical protein
MHSHRPWSWIPALAARQLPAVVMAGVLIASTLAPRSLVGAKLVSCGGIGGVPTITSVRPNQGPPDGGTVVTITGSGFCSTTPTTVAFGTTAAPSPFVVDDSTINVKSPAHAPGFADVTVTTAGGTSVPTAACSTSQYQLEGNDGLQWQPMDPGGLLTVTFQPTVDSLAILTGNADLWTSNAGFNQDLGIYVQGGGVYPTAGDQPEAWKESGGSAGILSPNAATVQTVIHVTATDTYTASLQWKTNRFDPGTIWAGAGPIAGKFSPTCLSFRLIPSTPNPAAVVTTQPQQGNSDGSTWKVVDAALSVPFTAPSDGSIVMTGNADLWTSTAGFNQDIGIFVSVNGAPSQLVAWKESGGLAGAFSPNAAFVMGVLPVTSGGSYVATLEWKANKAGSSTIWAGAGPIRGKYSPTSLNLLFVSSSTDNPSNLQYNQPNSDGTTWVPIDASKFTLLFTPSKDCEVILSGNADLWTQNGGFGQDLGIAVSVGGGLYPSVAGQPEAWKESGGGVTYAPNAAYVQLELPLRAGLGAYTITLVWKANRPDPGTIWAGAGVPGNASSTRLTLQPESC